MSVICLLSICMLIKDKQISLYGTIEHSWLHLNFISVYVITNNAYISNVKNFMVIY